MGRNPVPNFSGSDLTSLTVTHYIPGPGLQFRGRARCATKTPGFTHPTHLGACTGI